ncbi:MAG: hypothetical protein MUD08_10890 [Cytophagales bacterium]|jgi:hypothetical protein|nr:hypothetical protein [Cytophagales bacterium]
MTKPKTLELDDKPDLHRGAEVAQRILWIAMSLLVLAGGLGLFGGGPLSKHTEGDTENGFRIQYDRFARHEATTELEMRWRVSHTGEATVAFPADYMAVFDVSGIVPAPVRVHSEQNRVFYHFSGSGDFIVLFKLRPDQVGRINGYVEANGKHVVLRHFVFP